MALGLKSSPVARISLGLVLVTCSVVVALDVLGLAPLSENQEIEVRARLSEQLAAQTLLSINTNHMGPARLALEVAVKRNPDVLSAAVRSAAGRLVISAGSHRMLWMRNSEKREPGTHVTVPIMKGSKQWGTLEVRFADPPVTALYLELWNRPLIKLLVGIATTCFVAFLFYLRRSLKHLDPSSVIPTRVQVALDVMAEGVLLLDDQERIVLANETFCNWLGASNTSLLGEVVSDLDWRSCESQERASLLPWTESIVWGKEQTRAPLLIVASQQEPRMVMVNVAPVLDGWGSAKGVIVTLDDVTELEQRRAGLEVAMKRLEETQEEIRLQNEELQIQATRDPLTGVANRRAFFDEFEPRFDTAKREEQPLSCLMADIDHFKLVNDNHGHAAGDVVIKSVADALRGAVDSVERVCRYGGEEFCIVLDAGEEQASRVAEELRRKIETPGFTRIPITASFGVATLEAGAKDLGELINHADQALYVSKESGRNRVTCWKPGMRDAS